MSSAIFAYRNLADSGAVTVSSALALTPAARLTSQFPQLAKKCRNNGENAWAVTVDLGSAQSVDTFALFGLNLGATATARVRLATADSSGQAGDAYDSGTVAGLIDDKYGALIMRALAPVTGRYARFDVAQNGAAYIEAGRVFVGSSEQVAINFAPGWGRSRVDQSRRSESENGVIYIDRRTKYRQLELSFDFLSETEADGFVEDMDFRNGESDDVLLILDPDSANLGRDSLWGLISGGQPIIGPYPMPDIFSRKYTIRERL